MLVSVAVVFLLWLLVMLPGWLHREFTVAYTASELSSGNLQMLANSPQFIYCFVTDAHKISTYGENQARIQFRFLPKKQAFTFFTTLSRSGHFLNVFLQGKNENFQLSLQAESHWHFSLSYETDSTWRAGIMFYNWPKVKKELKFLCEQIENHWLELQQANYMTLDSTEVESDVSVELPHEEENKLIAEPETAAIEADEQEETSASPPEQSESNEWTNDSNEWTETPETAHEIQAKNNFHLQYLTIPVADLYRAKWFYTNVFGFWFTDEEQYPLYLSHFQYPEGAFLGALVFGQEYFPQQTGPVAFVPVADAAYASELIVKFGGFILLQYHNINGSAITKFIDSEGNMVGMIQC
ncbi:hypothetical protein GC194_13330 [bacterium]|nr:hypothetical protein [bacterium]